MSPISGMVRLSPSADSDTQSSDSGVTDTHPEGKPDQKKLLILNNFHSWQI